MKNAETYTCPNCGSDDVWMNCDASVCYKIDASGKRTIGAGRVDFYDNREIVCNNCGAIENALNIEIESDQLKFTE